MTWFLYLLIFSSNQCSVRMIKKDFESALHANFSVWKSEIFSQTPKSSFQGKEMVSVNKIYF